MPSCAVKGCKNYDTKVKKKHGISYHRFPIDPVRSEIWCRIIRIQRNEPYFKARKGTRICSAHFSDDDVDVSNAGLRRLKDSAVPRLHVQVCKNKKPRRPSTPIQPTEVDEIEVDISDLEPIFDSPVARKLRKRVAFLEKRHTVALTHVSRLRRENARLKTLNKSLRGVIKNLKCKLVENERNANNEEIDKK